MPETKPELPPPSVIDDLDRPGCPVVGVGASAGGLEAFSNLLRALPGDTGMAFVLVQHLAPSHASALAEILGRITVLPVQEVHDRVAVAPNHVYVIPPGQDMVIRDGALELSPRSPTGAHRPIDHFFRTLAEESRHRAIGVVLSGTATDGTLGLQAIKEEGGITFAQDASAQHDGMPQSAIASGCVDFVLSPQDIAREIVRISRRPEPIADETPEPVDAARLAPILRELQRAKGVDFTHYKFSTVYRRISRRMLLQKANSLSDYARLLQDQPAEVDALYQDILINVTSFFRNPEAFEALVTKVFPRLVKKRAHNDAVRIWSLGCSTGEEAYSLAIAYAEFSEATGNTVPLQLFATDLNASSIERARAGVFTEIAVHELSPARLQRYFVPVNGSYRIAKGIRDACVFSRHNVLADPPFSRIDLISCRNLLIYFDTVLQQQVVPTLHFALKPGGCLWLGASETLGAYQNLFESEDSKFRIYTKKPGTGLERAAPHPVSDLRSAFAPTTARALEGALELQREADRFLLSKFSPPGVLVSSDLEILQYRGDTTPYLTPSPGKATLSLLKMLREGLLVPVRAAILRAESGETPAREEGSRVRTDDGHREVAVEVLRVQASNTQKGFLVLFEDTSRVRDTKRPKRTDVPKRTEAEAELQGSARLAEQLAATHEYLQSVVEQQEAANEELQTANEEVQSANEELQSINEELETSKEEIQASNEELAIVNDELRNRNIEVSRVNNDLVNVLGSVQVAIVMLDANLRVRRFTSTAEALLKLVPSDVGRAIGTIRLGVALPNLEVSLVEVLRTGRTLDVDVRDAGGRWYSLRLRPYKTPESGIDGVILMLIDVDIQVRAREYAESVVLMVREPLLVLDAELRVRTANRAFCETYAVAPEDVEGALLGELSHRQWNVPELHRALHQVLIAGTEFSDFAVRDTRDVTGERMMLLHARRLVQEIDREPSILLALEDVTERTVVEADRARESADLLAADQRKNEFLAILAHELRTPLAPIRDALSILEATRDPALEQRTREMMKRQLDQMVYLIDDLLDVSRITHGKIDLRLDRVDLGATVTHAVDVARPQCEAAGLELTQALPQETVFVNGDATRLAQVVVNLLSNAAKFTDRGGHVRVTVERDGEIARIRVRDDGIGIVSDQLERIFELFTQVDTSLERSRSGLGIGLTLAKTLIELHGGTIGVASEGLGHGSEFTVSLPVYSASSASGPSESALRDGGAPPSRRILVVDDNRDAAEALSELLQIRGHETRTAFDGLEALQVAAEFRPEVVLLDIGLPKLNGYETAQQLRRETWGTSITLIALTGWGQDDDRRRTREAGFDAHLVKPVDHALLATLLLAPS